MTDEPIALHKIPSYNCQLLFKNSVNNKINHDYLIFMDLVEKCTFFFYKML
jgi:hypothetical protein